MLAQYFVYLQFFKTQRQLKLAAFLRFFSFFTPKEIQEITEEFYEFYPVLREEKNIVERLNDYENHSATPDSGLMLCLQEYFELRQKSIDFDKI